MWRRYIWDARAAAAAAAMALGLFRKLNENVTGRLTALDAHLEADNLLGRLQSALASLPPETAAATAAAATTATATDGDAGWKGLLLQ